MGVIKKTAKNTGLIFNRSMKKKKHIDKILDKLDWQEAWKLVPVRKLMTRIEDDSLGNISVLFTMDGDAWIDIEREHPGSLRFREIFMGGGESARVRAALMVLALAIQADNEDRPQNRG